MIKDILVRLDGTPQDDIRLAAVDQIATIFQSHITGLYFNLQSPSSSGESAKENGDAVEAAAMARLTGLQQPTHLRRFDLTGEEDVPDTAMLPARAADTFVELCPDSRSSNPERLIERLLFGAGRHLFLVPNDIKALSFWKHAIVAWNGSREAARALAEAMPYLHRAEKVGVSSSKVRTRRRQTSSWETMPYNIFGITASMPSSTGRSVRKTRPPAC